MRSGMTGEEFAAARATLGLGIDELAAELNLTPHVVEAMESGSVRIPDRIAKDLAFRAVLRERELVLANSGLPECATAAALERTATGNDPESALKRLGKMTAHAASCPDCQARSEFVKRHAPPLPEYPMPGWVRGIGWIDRQLSRMPQFLRPPEGAAGEGRRIAVFAAAGFSILAIGIAAFGALSAAVTHRSEPGWWREPLAIAVFAPIGYFVGFFLAGWGFDVTRRIRHRFIGYVMRGTLGAAAVYGTMGLVMPMIEKGDDWRDWPIMVGVFAVVGALGGGILWVVHRVRGKLPSRVT